MDKENTPVRRYRRCSLDTVAGVSRLGEFLFENSVDISEGGMKLDVNGNYQVGEQIDVFFFVPSGRFVRATCEVLYLLEVNERRQIGVRFMQPSDNCTGAIRDYVAQV